MGNERYVAYVGTYTHGNSVGIHIYDLDVEQGKMVERKVIPINNPSDLTVSKDGRFLYSIADEGVKAFRILPDGDLEAMNKKWIGGMRGCYVAVDDKNRYLFVAGYHDGRVTMMHLEEDGSIGEIADGIFHKGMGRNIAERSSRPHVNCVELTPLKQNYICAVDGGLDHVKIYQLDYEHGKLKIADILRCPLSSAPRMIRFTKDGNYAYVLCELKNTVEVHRYMCTPDGPKFEFIQSIRTVDEEEAANGGASGMELTEDGRYLFCSNAGTNTVIIYEINQETGILTEVCSSAISGDYPKTLGIFPDGRHFVSLNHDTNEIILFAVDYEKKYFLMKGRPIRIETPNCIHIHKLQDVVR
ncbi:MAG: lactonase family protein [Lachnospiraceae bacterium]|jgi:6-phosphogluconolactonase|nr:lactonase family protein [Lachnospiraceae bacterium]